MISWPLIQYVFKAAVNDRLIISMILILAVTASVSVFLSSSAITEQDQFTSVFTASALRLVGALGLVLFTVFFIRRSYETKDVEFLLSRPVSRIQFVFSYASAFSLVAVILAALVIAILYFNAFAVLPFDGFILWSVSLILEYVIIVNVAFFFSMVLSSSAGASMASFAFYVLARIMGQLLGIIDSGKTDPGPLQEIVEFTIQVISAITPRLDLYAQSSWLLYGVGDNINLVFILAQALIFSLMVLLAALIDLIRRQF